MKIIKKSFFILLIVFSALYPITAETKTMSIVVKEAKVYATPSMLGKIIATFKYTNTVFVTEEKGSWLRVSLPGSKQGWIHISTVTSNSSSLKSGLRDSDVTASSDEVALAGKGFNKEVEAEYKKESKLDFKWVDNMEKFKVTIDEIKAFLLKGGLDTGSGGEK